MYEQAATSIEAYNRIKPKLPSIREQVFNMIEAKGDEGLIYEEIALAFPSTSYSSGLREATKLAKAGKTKEKLDENGNKVVRRNSKGNNQKVWVIA